MTNRSFVLAATVVGALALPIPGTLAETAIQSPENHTPGDVSMTNATKSASLKVPGATLYYEVQGQGPTLLIIPGGPQDAGVFAELSQRLANRYTVVAYDPRGNSRSSFDGEIKPLLMDQQADDAAALIEALGNGPAYVFGTSGGAQIGLNLAARHPELVEALVAHEPPSMMLMDDPTEAVAADKALYDTYVKEGVDAAMGMFFSMNGLEEGGDATEAPPEFEMPPEEAETFARVSGNFEYWLAHGMLPLSLYTPDVATLRAGKPRIVVAVGEASAGQPIEEMSLALTGKLGIAPTPFPGDHMGFGPQAAEFAEALHASFVN
ncbi:MAG TPA: alpha/beta hydrolase [Devosia sp.]|jgi:pimeloyl-ACP methyl ester carboxylesterase|uniref:alpha/beta fold hydrolase n=1 Tax=Devosia sp. TaxID=1871048 RepID=UPI002DDD54B8|nr:alpha/beta hydrolase [Devosia sp.]HEV2516248.1 alpha/beta hydrolase [Devosia sp.]